jgi:CMP-N,N'-diacetyllegionaminic acid synthase
MINGKKILSVITARAGSKGIPMKNVKNLLGQPLFTWSVSASFHSKYIDCTVVSSNCDKVREITDKYFKNIWPGSFYNIKRPDEFATDTSKNEEAIIHALRNVEGDYDIVINLQPTSPCRLDNLLDKTIEMYYNGDYDSLLTASKGTPFIWQKYGSRWYYSVDKNGCCNRKMRQEFEEQEFTYHDNGNIYITDTQVMLGTECRIGKKPCIFETTKMNSLQIDEEFDFKLIENMAKAYNLESLI